MLPRLSFILQGMMVEQNGLDFFHSLYVNLQSQLAGSNTIVLQELQIERGNSAKLTSDRVSLCHQKKLLIFALKTSSNY